MEKTIDINCDMGESFGRYTCGMDADVLPLITTANVACGFHASDPVVMSRTVFAAAASHVRVGAHTGFPDLEGFGRRAMSLTPAQIQADTEYQIGALWAFARAARIKVTHVKPHGALYNIAVKDEKTAQAICDGITAIDPSLILLAPEHSEMTRCARRSGLSTAGEVFADRAYMEDGTLVPRTMDGAMIKDPAEAAARVLRMVKEGVVTSITGRDISVQADSVCIHGDSPNAVAFARHIVETLRNAGIQIRAFA